MVLKFKSAPHWSFKSRPWLKFYRLSPARDWSFGAAYRRGRQFYWGNGALAMYQLAMRSSATSDSIRLRRISMVHEDENFESRRTLSSRNFVKNVTIPSLLLWPTFRARSSPIAVVDDPSAVLLMIQSISTSARRPLLWMTSFWEVTRLKRILENVHHQIKS